MEQRLPNHPARQNLLKGRLAQSASVVQATGPTANRETFSHRPLKTRRDKKIITENAVLGGCDAGGQGAAGHQGDQEQHLGKEKGKK